MAIGAPIPHRTHPHVSESDVKAIKDFSKTAVTMLMRNKGVRYWGMIPLLSALLIGFALAGRSPLLQPGKATLHQRVLTRPGAELVTTAGESAGRLVDAFSRFYVYGEQALDGQQWLEVGIDTLGTVKGWLRADQTVPWKQQLTLAFTNPAAKRDPVLFFNSRDTVETLLELESPATEVETLVRTITSGGRDDRVVAIEPDRFIDINKQFYLLPILDFEEVYLDSGHTLRTLKVASVTKQDLLPAQPGQPAHAVSEAPVTPLQSFKAGVVFVIDSTVSMKNYIDETRIAVKQVYDRIKGSGILDKVSFGLVAFRAKSADKGRSQKLEYVAKEFVDPSEVSSAAEFLLKAAALTEAKVSTDHFSEDAYACVLTALEEVPWNRFGARYLVLVTDAGALEGAGSQSGLHAEQVRSEAAEKGVAIFVFHLKTPAGAKNHADAQAQYLTLSNNPAIQQSLYFPVETGSVQRFSQAVNVLSDALIKNIEAAAKGEAVAGSARAAESKDIGHQKAVEDPEMQKLRQVTQTLGHAMQLAYLGKMQRTKAPQVFDGWITDRDLADPTVRTVEERVLLTKNQLSDLQMILKEIVDAADRGVIEPDSFFDSLRSIAAQYGRDPNLATRAEARKLADLGLLGEYLEGLPYQSDVMNVDQDTWSRWGTQRQYDFINKLKSKIRLYERYNADRGRWVSLAEGSPVGEQVYPVRLRDLP